MSLHYSLKLMYKYYRELDIFFFKVGMVKINIFFFNI